MLYILQTHTRCHRCGCIILPTDDYVSFNFDGCIVFAHREGL